MKVKTKVANRSFDLEVLSSASGKHVVNTEAGRKSQLTDRTDRPGLSPGPASWNSSATWRLSGRILLVEPNAADRVVAVEMLTELGVDVEIARDSVDALKKFSGDVFDLVIIDGAMAVADNFTTSRAIRLQEAGSTLTPILSLLHPSLPVARDKCYAAGITDFVMKPFNYAQLHAILALFLRHPLESSSAVTSDTRHRQDSSDKRPEPNSPVDTRALSVLSDLQQPGAPNFIHRVIRIYLTFSVIIKNQLVTALFERDWAAVKESSQALKSSSLNIGAKGLADLCSQLELAERDHDLCDLPALQNKLVIEYDRVVSSLQTQLNEKS